MTTPEITDPKLITYPLTQRPALALGALLERLVLSGAINGLFVDDEPGPDEDAALELPDIDTGNDDTSKKQQVDELFRALMPSILHSLRTDDPRLHVMLTPVPQEDRQEPARRLVGQLRNLWPVSHRWGLGPSATLEAGNVSSAGEQLVGPRGDTMNAFTVDGFAVELIETNTGTRWLVLVAGVPAYERELTAAGRLLRAGRHVELELVLRVNLPPGREALPQQGLGLATVGTYPRIVLSSDSA